MSVASPSPGYFSPVFEGNLYLRTESYLEICAEATYPQSVALIHCLTAKLKMLLYNAFRSTARGCTLKSSTTMIKATILSYPSTQRPLFLPLWLFMISMPFAFQFFTRSVPLQGFHLSTEVVPLHCQGGRCFLPMGVALCLH